MSSNEIEIGKIFLGERCNRQIRVGKIQTLFGLEPRALARCAHHPRDQAPWLDSLDLRAELAIVNVDAVGHLCRLQRLRQGTFN